MSDLPIVLAQIISDVRCQDSSWGTWNRPWSKQTTICVTICFTGEGGTKKGPWATQRLDIIENIGSGTLVLKLVKRGDLGHNMFGVVPICPIDPGWWTHRNGEGGHEPNKTLNIFEKAK